MSAHTPGPLDDVLRDVVLTDVERRLIAAVPEMLKALKQLVADYEDVPDPSDNDGQGVFEDARAAIARAEGRS